MGLLQTIICVFLVLVAAVYIGRRIYFQVRSLLSTKADLKIGCATGCGNCSGPGDGCEDAKSSAQYPQSIQPLVRR
jgi:hypothetical protein